MNAEIRKKYESNVWKIPVLYVIAGFAMSFFVIQLFYYQHYNLTFFQISLISSFGLLVTLLAEVPTGAFADLYGRKKSLIVGFFCFTIGIFVLTFSSIFWLFLLASMIIGLGQAFMSGAWEAFLFDTLKAIKREKDYLKIVARQSSFFLAVIMISSLASPYLFSINVKYPFYIGSFFSIIMFLFCFALYEPEVKQKTVSIKKHLKQMQDGFNYILKHKKVLWLIALGCIILIPQIIGQELTGPPFTIFKGFTIKQYGVVGFVLLLTQIIGMNLSHKIEKKLKGKKAITYTFLLWIIFSLAAFYSWRYLFVLFSGLSGMFVSMTQLIVDSSFNHRLRKKIRATVISIYSMIASFLGILSLTIIGRYIDTTSVENTVLIIIFITLFLGLLLIGIRYKSKMWKK